MSAAARAKLEYWFLYALSSLIAVYLGLVLGGMTLGWLAREYVKQGQVPPTRELKK